MRSYPEIPTTPCETYDRMVNAAGYARRWVGSGHASRKIVYAHRYAWEQTYGPIPDGLTLDHLCFTKTCVRLDHLELVTLSENVARKPAARKTHCLRGHELSANNLVAGCRYRTCKKCHAMRHRRRLVSASPEGA